MSPSPSLMEKSMKKTEDQRHSAARSMALSRINRRTAELLKPDLEHIITTVEMVPTRIEQTRSAPAAVLSLATRPSYGYACLWKKASHRSIKVLLSRSAVM